MLFKETFTAWLTMNPSQYVFVTEIKSDWYESTSPISFVQRGTGAVSTPSEDRHMYFHLCGGYAVDNPCRRVLIMWLCRTGGVDVVSVRDVQAEGIMDFKKI